MSKTHIILLKTYYGEDLSDLERDIYECLDARFNPSASVVSCDEEDGMAEGFFVVKVEWVEPNKEK